MPQSPAQLSDCLHLLKTGSQIPQTRPGTKLGAWNKTQKEIHHPKRLRRASPFGNHTSMAHTSGVRQPAPSTVLPTSKSRGAPSMMQRRGLHPHPQIWECWAGEVQDCPTQQHAVAGTLGRSPDPGSPCDLTFEEWEQRYSWMAALLGLTLLVQKSLTAAGLKGDAAKNAKRSWS